MTERPMPHSPAVDFVDHLRRDIDRLAAVIADSDLTLAVPHCPGWDLHRLAVHVGNVHRWATQAAHLAAPPPSRPADPDTGVELGGWLRSGGDALIDVLQSLDPLQPTWHPFPTDQIAGVWPRRMAHETAIHRVDAELSADRGASQAASAIDAELASDGIDEYFGVMVAGAAQRRGLQLPASTLHVHCTDVHGEWLVWAKGSSVNVQREHAKGDVALRGPASSLLLALWGRTWSDQEVEVLGDTAAGHAWLTVGGV